MKKSFLLFLFVILSSLVTGNLYADTSNHDNYSMAQANDGCIGQIDTKYVKKNTGIVELQITVPSADEVISVSGPYVPNPSWRRSGSKQIIVNLNTNKLDGDWAWMEIIVPGGYYHVKLIYM